MKQRRIAKTLRVLELGEDGIVRRPRPGLVRSGQQQGERSGVWDFKAAGGKNSICG